MYFQSCQSCPSLLMISYLTQTSFRERRGEPRLVVALLLVCGLCDRNDAVSGVRARAEFDGEGAQLVGAEDRERYGVAGPLVRDARVEEVERGAIAVYGDYLVAGVESLLVCGRARGDVSHDEFVGSDRPAQD